MRHLVNFICLIAIGTSGYAAQSATTTPIQYLVVIFQENRTFDHYFGTYPIAQNNPGESPFYPKISTPSVNGLAGGVLVNNQNSTLPFRLAPSQVNTSDPNHTYTVLQQACHAGLMDQFVETTGIGCNPPNIVMGYFDGNTVTAYWNYAQHFAMSDNFHTTNICGSSVGAINLISGQVHGATPANYPDYIYQGTLINDLDPLFDQCSASSVTPELSGINVGNLLNAQNITWGWFQGGFSNCSASHVNPYGQITPDYIPHHNPFQYYASTSNQQHLPPSSPYMVGHTDQANHNYDLSDFWAAIKVGNLPNVSFLKAAAYQDGHAGYSNPLNEQEFIVNTINTLQKLPQWKQMAIIIAYDDSGGWYDHEMPTIVNESQSPYDALVTVGNSGDNPPLGGYQGRIGYGLRVPFLLISPWAKENYVSHTLIDQSSILRFIEENWKLGQIGDFSFDALAGSIMDMFYFGKRNTRYLFMNPTNGQIIHNKFLDRG